MLRPRLRTAGQQFAIGPGWRRLVLDCHHRISAEFPAYELLAVKQKYGRLSFQAFPRPWRPGERSWTPEEHARLHDLLDATTARSEACANGARPPPGCAAPAASGSPSATPARRRSRRAANWAEPHVVAGQP
ncbi:hypothetical protein ACFQVA_15890 [Actinomadura keratinilytica]